MTDRHMILSVHTLPPLAHVVTSFEPCPDCRGRGTHVDELTPGVVMAEICSTCEGAGVIPVLAEAVGVRE